MFLRRTCFTWEGSWLSRWNLKQIFKQLGTGSVLYQNLIIQNVRIKFITLFFLITLVIITGIIVLIISHILTRFSTNWTPTKIYAVQPILSTLATVCATSLLSKLVFYNMNNGLMCWGEIGPDWNQQVSIQHPTKILLVMAGWDLLPYCYSTPKVDYRLLRLLVEEQLGLGVASPTELVPS